MSDPAGSLRRAAALLAGTAAIALALLVFAREPIDVAAYVRRAAFSTLVFWLLFGLGWYFERGAQRACEGILRVPIWVWAALVFVAAVVAESQVFDAIPHTSDEAAYQFQARALAQGRLGFEPPAGLEFFNFVHLSGAGGVWHGIMNPGWPALLAPAVKLGVPQLMNPLLAAATLLLLYGALRRTELGETAARLCTLGLACSPMFVFLAATAMSHTANLFVFALFLYAWARQRSGPQLGWAVLGGLALAVGATMRPLDTAAAAAPFGLWQLAGALRDRTRLPALLATGAAASTGIVALLAYNAALTGSALVFPQEIHFERLHPGQQFGFGFGAEMGTVVHGPEWPGYYPSDAPRVTSHRLLVWLEDLHGLPLVLLAGLLAFARPRRDGPWSSALFASAAGLVLVYLGHFYHGVAYGARHYTLALPGTLAVLAIPAARAIEAGGRAARLGRAACLAVPVYALVFATPPLVREYSDDYRQASGAVREASERGQLHHALVFVHPDRWGWKSAFPLNEYPLERNDVLYARDLGPRNVELRRLFPDRVAYRARFGADGRAHLRELPRLGSPDDAARSRRERPQ